MLWRSSTRKSKSAPWFSPHKANHSAPAPVSATRSGRSREPAAWAAAKKADPADGLGSINSLYLHAVRIFRAKKPIVAAVQGAAIGGGPGLPGAADFPVPPPPR